MSCDMSHRTCVAIFVAAFALTTTTPRSACSSDNDVTDIKAEITKRHDEAVKRLQDWIRQVSIAAENRGYPEGAEYTTPASTPNQESLAF
jgi:hypothetical protein